jgi:hypothetical protein
MRTTEAGLDSVRFTNGVAVADYDLDSKLDIYFVASYSFKPNNKFTWSRLYAANQDNTFRETTVENVMAGKVADSIKVNARNGASWGDYDNDGYPDIYLANIGQNILLHNNGDGTFSDVTATAGVAGHKDQYSTSAVWFDYDIDGDLDLYVSNWDILQMSRFTKNCMYENIGNSNFLDVSDKSGLADSGDTWMAIAIDVNNDGFLDLYVANDFGPNHLFVNNGDKTFTEMTKQFGLEYSAHGMGIAVGDCDGNGYFDIYVTNVTEMNTDETNPLFLNNGSNFWINKAAEAGVALAGWGWGTEFFDFDNDSDEDLYVVNGYFTYRFENRFFRNDSNADTVYFMEIGKEIELNDIKDARGLAVFDYNDDGKLDIIISNNDSKPSFYENAVQAGNWLKINLEGTETNRNAFGTVVELEANGKTYKRYHHGAQFFGQNILPVHFGLGKAQIIDRVTVKWLNGHIDEIKNVNVNQTIYIKEKSAPLHVSQEDIEKNFQPDDFILSGNYPNPFNSSTQITFEIKNPGEIELEIFNALGQRIKSFKESYSDPGSKNIRWDAGESSTGLVSGFYFYVMKNNIGKTKTGKMIYLK